MYKIITNYSAYSADKEAKQFKIVDFDELCEIKKINKKTVNKSGYTKQSTKRDFLKFPHKNKVANMFGVSDYTKLFNDEGEAIASSRETTMAYIKAIGLNLDDYSFSADETNVYYLNHLLRMAA